MRERDLTTLFVDVCDMSRWDESLCANVLEAHYRLEPLLRRAAWQFAARHLGEYASAEDGSARDFWVAFVNVEHEERLRELRSARVGKLSQWTGTVTRSTEVRPELFLGAFKCGVCGSVTRDVPQQFKYTQPAVCGNEGCDNRADWELVPELSRFVDWQKCKVQETPEEVPAGCLPRSMDVILRGDAVEAVRPGDRATFAGTLVVVPDVAALAAPGERAVSAPRGGGGGGGGSSALDAALSAGGEGGVTGLTKGPVRTGARELTYRLAFVACSAREAVGRGAAVGGGASSSSRAASSSSASAAALSSDLFGASPENETPEEALASMTTEEAAAVEAARRDPDLYERLVESIAPGVFGAKDVKRAVLLQLLGGVPKTTKEGMRLRGDINVAIVGDPACAKSQILRWVSSFAPRSVFASGKASTAAGLTAAVVRDEETGEFCVEAGAMMLADRGIACVDEFDKMDARDAVAIHEAMEQQTISLAKAGVQATLNARASVLAAANPAGGRYDRSRPLRANVALPPAILSRFDLLHVLLDEADPAADRAVAKHILDVHRGRGTAKTPPYPPAALRRYLRVAKAVKPRLSKRAQNALAAAYVRLRSDDAAPGSGNAYRITVRQLEALVRLSEALARLRMRPQVTPADVREAHRLVRDSVAAVAKPDAKLRDSDWLDMAGQGEEGEEGEGERGGEGEDAEMPPAVSGESGTDTAGEEAARENGDGNRDANENRENRDGNRSPRDSAAARAAQLGSAPSGSRPSAAAAATTTVPRAKFDHIKNLLLLRLRKAERDAEQAANEGGAEEPETAEETERTADAAAAAATAPAPPSAAESSGLTQRALLRWYFDYLVSRDAVPDAETGANELALAERVLAHLVKREGCVTVVEEPPARDGESRAAHARRVRHDRILAIHPNYEFDD